MNSFLVGEKVVQYPFGTLQVIEVKKSLYVCKSEDGIEVWTPLSNATRLDGESND